MTEIVALSILGFVLGPPIVMILIIFASEGYNMYYREKVEFFFKNLFKKSKK